MTTDLECRAAYQPPLARLQVRGTLSLSTTPGLRSALLKCLADQPTAIVVDASALTTADDTSLTVFIAAARHAAAWPSIPILVAACRPNLGRVLRRLGIDRHVVLCDSVSQARGLVADRVLPRQVRERLTPTPAAVRNARLLVADTCQLWGLPQIAPAAGLVISELVTNSVCHAGTRMEMILSRGPRHLHLAIRDHNHDRPRLRGAAGEGEPGGRGLLLVESLAASWGYTRTHDGKVTWATLSTLPPAGPAARRLAEPAERPRRP